VPKITVKQELLSDLQKRVNDKILEKSNYDLLKKLIKNADTLDEAIKIAELGTTYKRTGFHFDKRLEKQSDTISYFKKNKKLSFESDPKALTHKLIIGDNYPALLNLLIEYKSKIDVIVIDPPYGKDDMGDFADTNYENAITRDNLLSMLYPRLYLAKQLLSDTGVIFCSIDDKNQAYVKCLFDEIFEENNTEVMLWRKSGDSRDGKMKNTTTFRIDHEYIIVSYKGKKSLNKLLEKPNFINEYTNPDNDPRGCYKAGSISLKEEASNPNSPKYYSVTSPSGKIFTRQFDFPKEKFEELYNDKVINSDGKYVSRIYWGKNDDAVPSIKIFIDEERYVTPSSIFLNNGTTTSGTEELNSILNDDYTRMRPKPTFLIKTLIQLGSNIDSIILDFFAGSGTTGQAVLELNKKDKGNRQFILATNNEVTDISTNGIVKDVTSKRLKRVMTGKCYDGTNNFEWIKKNKPLGGNLLVLDIAEVANFEAVAGKTAFDVIDETLYGNEKFKTVKEKIEWVCDNFEITQKRLEEK